MHVRSYRNKLHCCNKIQHIFHLLILAVYINVYFYLNMRRNFFTLRVTQHLNRPPREVVESLYLEMFKTHLDEVLCSLLYVTLLWQRGWTR